MKHLLIIPIFLCSINLTFSQLTLLYQGQPVADFQTLFITKGQTLKIVAQLMTNDLDMDDIDRFPDNLGTWIDSTTVGGNLMIETFEWQVTNDTIFDFFDHNNTYNINFKVVAEDAAADLDITGGAKISTMDTILNPSSNVVRADDGTLAVREYEIGDFAQGGIIFWVDATGEHGLVCAKTDQSSSIRWSAGTNGNTQAKGDGPGAGKMNSIIIIISQVEIGDDNAIYAARLCNELEITEGGFTYGDWYLPSKEELNLMYLNKALIDATAQANGGDPFSMDDYWTSNEYFEDANIGINAWIQFFFDGAQDPNSKINGSRVRAIRAF